MCSTSLSWLCMLNCLTDLVSAAGCPVCRHWPHGRTERLHRWQRQLCWPQQLLPQSAGWRHANYHNTGKFIHLVLKCSALVFFNILNIFLKDHKLLVATLKLNWNYFLMTPQPKGHIRVQTKVNDDMRLHPESSHNSSRDIGQVPSMLMSLVMCFMSINSDCDILSR